MEQSPTILLAEDDSNDALLMRLVLEKDRPDVRLSLVTNGSEAMKYLQGKQPYADRLIFPLPGLVLLDAGMPGLTGFQVLRWIREQSQLEGLPVVLVTNLLSEQDVQRAYDLGADSCLVKPQGLDELGELMSQLAERWLGAKQLHGAVADWSDSAYREAA